MTILFDGDGYELRAFLLTFLLVLVELALFDGIHFGGELSSVGW